MNAVVTGILLPESLLAQPWFHTFALFVAFNTIVYLGLTLSKLVPWPAQIHPDRVRVILPSVQSKDITMKDIPRSERQDPTGEFARRRLLTAAGSIPLALSLLAGVVVIITTVLLVFVSSTISPLQVAIYAVAIGMLIWAQISSHAGVSARIVVWSWSVLVLALIVLISLYGILFDDAISMAYAVMLFVLLPGVAISWPASLVGGAIGLIVITWAGIAINTLDSLQWSIAALAAFSAGLVALAVRRNSIDRILLEEMKCQLLATTDPLTRSLTRSALEVLAPSVLQTADAAGQPVHLIMVDVASMTGINVDYGIAYGDVVILNVSQAVRSVVPSADLIARWDGDCFVAVGVGTGPDARGVERGVEDAIAQRGIALGKRPIEVRVAVVTAPVGDRSLEQLVHDAFEELPTRPARESAD